MRFSTAGADAFFITVPFEITDLVSAKSRKLNPLSTLDIAGGGNSLPDDALRVAVGRWVSLFRGGGRKGSESCVAVRVAMDSVGVVVAIVIGVILGLPSADDPGAPSLSRKRLQVARMGNVCRWSIEIEAFILEHTTHLS